MQVSFTSISFGLIQYNLTKLLGLPGNNGLPGIPGPKGEAVRVEVRKEFILFLRKRLLFTDSSTTGC